VFVSEDYAEINQQNQVKTMILAHVSRFFSNQGRLWPLITGERGIDPGGQLQTATRRRRGSNPIKYRPVAEIIETLKPAPAYASALRLAWMKSLNERCM